MGCVEKMARRGVGCRREGEKRVDSLGHFGDAAMAVLKHRIKPAWIGEPAAHDARDLLLEGAGDRSFGLARVEMIERGRRAKRGRGRSKAARVVGDAIAIENVALAVVLDMHQSVGFRDARIELRLGWNAVASAVIGMRGGGEIGAADIFARGPIPVEHLGRGARAVNTRRVLRKCDPGFHRAA